MARVSKATLRRILTVSLLTITLVMPAATSDKSAAKGSSSVAELQEVKLRKLHLVRPDLIPYPIAYEVFC